MISFFDYLKQYYLLIIIIIIGMVNLYFNIYKLSNVINNYSSIEKTEDSPILEEDKVISTNQSLFKVDIKGEVKKTGVYEVNDNMNVNDVINLAGGLTKNADTSNVNLSKKVTNEMVIYIANKKAPTSKTIIKNDAQIDATNSVGVIKEANIEQASSSIALININTANANELTTLPNIGEAKAKSIIEYRQTNGNFTSIEDIKKVSGIGDSLFAKIKYYIKI
jgi:competence protein ComEA